jgi:hypothetical protein
MKEYWGSWGTAPHILNLSTRRRWEVNFRVARPKFEAVICYLPNTRDTSTPTCLTWKKRSDVEGKKEAVVAYFKIISHDSFRRTGVSHENHQSGNRYAGCITMTEYLVFVRKGVDSCGSRGSVSCHGLMGADQPPWEFAAPLTHCLITVRIILYSQGVTVSEDTSRNGICELNTFLWQSSVRKGRSCKSDFIKHWSFLFCILKWNLKPK